MYSRGIVHIPSHSVRVRAGDFPYTERSVPRKSNMHACMNVLLGTVFSDPPCQLPRSPAAGFFVSINGAQSWCRRHLFGAGSVVHSSSFSQGGTGNVTGLGYCSSTRFCRALMLGMRVFRLVRPGACPGSDPSLRDESSTEVFSVSLFCIDRSVPKSRHRLLCLTPKFHGVACHL